MCPSPHTPIITEAVRPKEVGPLLHIRGLSFLECHPQYFLPRPLLHLRPTGATAPSGLGAPSLGQNPQGSVSVPCSLWGALQPSNPPTPLPSSIRLTSAPGAPGHMPMQWWWGSVAGTEFPVVSWNQSFPLSGMVTGLPGQCCWLLIYIDSYSR